jgi:hypothetical protein
MIRPVEKSDTTNPGEYINRVKKADPGQSPSSRDFTYAIEGATRDNAKKRRHWPGFGQDSYESSKADEPMLPEEQPSGNKPSNPSAEDHNLDVTV